MNSHTHTGASAFASRLTMRTRFGSARALKTVETARASSGVTSAAAARGAQHSIGVSMVGACMHGAYPLNRHSSIHAGQRPGSVHEAVAESPHRDQVDRVVRI